MNVVEQVEQAVAHYAHLTPPAIPVSAPAPEAELATPSRLAYALGWVVANAVVGARYRDSAIDALPVYHPEHGWDRFLLTRRVSCALLADEPADAFGLILLSGEEAPSLAHGNGEVRLALGPLLREDPERAIAALLELLPPVGLVPGDHARCLHVESAIYPSLYQAVTDLIVAHPGLVAAREVYVDAEQIEGRFHPLYLHSGGRTTGFVYTWFALEAPARSLFVNVVSGMVVRETERGTWAAEFEQLPPNDPDGIAERLRGWLALGEP